MVNPLAIWFLFLWILNLDHCSSTTFNQPPQIRMWTWKRKHQAAVLWRQLTFDLNGLLHLRLGEEHTLVLPARVVGDLVQTAEMGRHDDKEWGQYHLAKEVMSTDFRHRACEHKDQFPTGPSGKRKNQPVHAQEPEVEREKKKKRFSCELVEWPFQICYPAITNPAIVWRRSPLGSCLLANGELRSEQVSTLPVALSPAANIAGKAARVHGPSHS